MSQYKIDRNNLLITLTVSFCVLFIHVLDQLNRTNLLLAIQLKLAWSDTTRSCCQAVSHSLPLPRTFLCAAQG